MKKLWVVVCLILVGAVVQPAISNAVSGSAAVVLAQDFEDGEGGGPGCTQTCSPLPASCNGGQIACNAMPGCNTCMCAERDRNGNCTFWQAVPQTPRQH